MKITEPVSKWAETFAPANIGCLLNQSRKMKLYHSLFAECLRFHWSACEGFPVVHEILYGSRSRSPPSLNLTFNFVTCAYRSSIILVLTSAKHIRNTCNFLIREYIAQSTFFISTSAPWRPSLVFLANEIVLNESLWNIFQIRFLRLSCLRSVTVQIFLSFLADHLKLHILLRACSTFCSVVDTFW